MDFELSPELQADREFYREFTDRVIRPRAAEMDESESIPEEIIQEMRDNGIFGIPIRKEYSGQGKSYLSAVICREELAKASAAIAGLVQANDGAARNLQNFGTQEQKDKYLRKLATGEMFGCFAMTEAESGSDARNIKTNAKLDGDEWILNGSKLFITNAGIADYFCIEAMAPMDDGSMKHTLFIVDGGTKGFTVDKHERKMGQRCNPTCGLSMDECRIPKVNVLGGMGEGLHVALYGQDGARTQVAALSLGVAQDCIDQTVQYLKDNYDETGERIKDQTIKFKLAELQARIDAARLMTYKAATMWDLNVPFNNEASMAKYLSSVVANDAVSECVQFMGFEGLKEGNFAERALRDVKVTELYDGTSEIQLLVIGRHMGLKVKKN